MICPKIIVQLYHDFLKTVKKEDISIQAIESNSPDYYKIRLDIPTKVR